ncbi:MAG: hypothetical protein AABX39_01465 [Nanoarchaeota archaeon]
MYTTAGFKGELKELFNSLDDLVKGLSKGTKEQITLSASQQTNSFFNHLDYSLYNKEEINKIKKGVDEVMPQYVEATYGMYTEEPKVNTSMNKLFSVFLLGGVAIGLETAILLNFVAPAFIPVSALVGFWGGIYITDIVDGMISKKYEDFKKTKKELNKKCTSQIN